MAPVLLIDAVQCDFCQTSLTTRWSIVKVKSEQLTIEPECPDEVLKVWDVESSHKYENNQHTSQVWQKHSPIRTLYIRVWFTYLTGAIRTLND